MHVMRHLPFISLLKPPTNYSPQTDSPVQKHDTSPTVSCPVNSVKLHCCSVCMKGFPKEEEWRAHVKEHSGKRSLICEICCNGYIAKSAFERHLRTHNPRKHHACNMCEKSYVKRQSLSSHRFIKHPYAKPFRCSLCEEGFLSQGSLKVHLKEHTMQGVFCNTCKRQFHPEDLDGHLCGYSDLFNEKDELPVLNNPDSLLAHGNETQLSMEDDTSNCNPSYFASDVLKTEEIEFSKSLDTPSCVSKPVSSEILESYPTSPQCNLFQVNSPLFLQVSPCTDILEASETLSNYLSQSLKSCDLESLDADASQMNTVTVNNAVVSLTSSKPELSIQEVSSSTRKRKCINLHEEIYKVVLKYSHSDIAETSGETSSNYLLQPPESSTVSSDSASLNTDASQVHVVTVCDTASSKPAMNVEEVSHSERECKSVNLDEEICKVILKYSHSDIAETPRETSSNYLLQCPESSTVSSDSASLNTDASQMHVVTVCKATSSEPASSTEED